MTTTPATSQVLREVTFESWVPAAYAAKVAAANKRAERLGLGSPFAVSTTSSIVSVRDDSGIDRLREQYVIEVTLTGQDSLGWEFAGTLAWVDDAVIVRSSPFPSEALAAAGALPRPASKVCDHCQTARERIDTFLVFDAESGDFAQVGRNCLVDFTGIPVGWVRILDDLGRDDLDGYRDSVGYAAQTFDLRFALLATTQVVKACGFVSKKAADERGLPATSALVRDHILFPVAAQHLTNDMKAERARIDAQVADEALADAALAWAQAITDAQCARSEYMANVRTLASVSSRLEARHLGTVVSIVGVYQREQDKAAQREREAVERPFPTLPMPVAGDRIDVQGKIVSLRIIEGYYGSSTLLVIDDLRYAAPVKTFTSSMWSTEVEQGDEVHVKATVKGIEEYQGKKSIKVTRAALAKKK